MKFKEGDKVRVVSRKYRHCFEIGQEGLITEFSLKGKDLDTALILPMIIGTWMMMN